MMQRLMILGLGLMLAGLAHAGPPSVGDPAPSFTLPDQYGEEHSLEDFRGKWLAVYFYPKNDTPGCTTEACNFRDNIYAFRAIGAEVVGISTDDVDSHKEFSDKYKLPFTILADDTGATAQKYGVLGGFGAIKMAKRQSFLVNPDGVIVKHYDRVDPETHTQEVIADLEAFMDGDTPQA